ncbi:serine protease [Longispora fulva]|uniref:Subtilase family serine protease n=1 Tax=Longispora fulva TaxID=619741 RepID=A0A8J7GNX1_9ACTN|nr:S53 family peptidase [Longispora fulva]MBG6140513.1 subtilase family serine protease [Longispora fulva]GIG57105.1 serine protease [Longispora fulva]
MPMKFQRTALAGGLAAIAVLALAAPAAATPKIPVGTNLLADSTPMSVTLTLASADDQALTDYATAVSTPGSPVYGQHLTRDQLRQRFAAPADRVTRVKDWAAKNGFTSGTLDASGTRLTVTGNVRTARSAFSTAVVKTTVRGTQVRAVTARPKIPAQVARDITAVTGLSEQVSYPLNRRPAVLPAAAAAGQTCAGYWAQANNTTVPQAYPAGMQSNPICGYSYAQTRALYGLTDADRGAGQTIVVLGAFHNPNFVADAQRAATLTGAPAFKPGQLVSKIYEPSTGDKGCDPEGWLMEQALDIQSAHMIAPDATIVTVAAPDCTALESTVAKVIADPSIPTTLISNSWTTHGEPGDDQFITAFNNTLARSAALGIGQYFSSGDDGDTTALPNTKGPTASYPASSPWVTAVGGTTAGIGAGNKVVFQTGWETSVRGLSGGVWKPMSPSFLMGAGGGSSQRFDKPTWQNAIPGTKRQVPDIAALADPYTGPLMGVTINGQYIVTSMGGTSLASPIIASLVAVAQAKAGPDTVVGFLAPVLYAGAGKGLTADVGHVGAGIWTPQYSSDVPAGNYLLDADNGGQTLKTAAGWDNVTGLGTPGPKFLTDITK